MVKNPNYHFSNLPLYGGQKGCLVEGQIDDCQGRDSDIEIDEQFLEHQFIVVPAGHQDLAANECAIKKDL